MRDEQLLALIREDRSIALLLNYFDFDVERAADPMLEPVHLPNGRPLEKIAEDAAQGSFLRVCMDGPYWPVVYVGSEGEGGLIASSLRTTLALVVGLPSLHDATAIPLGDDGGRELRAYLAEGEEELRPDWPHIEADRGRLRAALDLPTAEDLLEALHAAAADDDYRPISDVDGYVYESMLRSQRPLSTDD